MHRLSRRSFLANTPVAIGVSSSALLVPSLVFAKDQPVVRPEDVGMSSARLARLDARLQSFINDGRRPGIVALIARRGKIVHHKAYGWANIGAGTPMATDTIMRQSSMTKPPTCAAMLMLYEQGKFQLTDPVEKYIPEFAALKIFAGRDADGEMILEAPRRKPTIHDLFRHTSGLTYGNFRDEALRKRWSVENPLVMTQAGFIKALVTYPLDYQPGEKWFYSVAHDVLGYLIELFSGMSFAEFLQTRLFDPLDMPSSFMGVPPAHRIDRISALYGRSKGEDGAFPVVHDPSTGEDHWYGKGAFGGSGMWTTARDYNQFAQMLLNRGSLDGNRLLHPRTVDFMVRNHLPPGVKVDPYPGQLYGLGVQVLGDLTLDGGLGSVGQYGWGGSSGTFYISDPKEELTTLWMTQGRPHDHPARRDFYNMACAAIIA